MKGQEKRFREFTNMLVMYLLEEQGMCVEFADTGMSGVDLVATAQKEDGDKKYAITLVRRNIPDTESKEVLFVKSRIDKLEKVAKELEYIPVAVFVITDTMQGVKKFRFALAQLDELVKMCEDKDISYVKYAADGDGIWLNYNEGINVRWLEEIKQNKKVGYMEAQLTYNNIGIIFPNRG